jgi:hypothetical protein
MATEGVLGIFAGASEAANAVRALRARGHRKVFAVMAAPFPEVIDALGRPASPLGWATLVGAFAGASCGFALCISTAFAWPLLTSGKPIVSVPPFAIVAFELAVLFGALATIASVVIGAFVARRRPPIPYDPAFSADAVGVFAAGPAEADLDALLTDAGAREIRHVS